MYYIEANKNELNLQALACQVRNLWRIKNYCLPSIQPSLLLSLVAVHQPKWKTKYECKSYVGPIWWIIDYPASLEHRTNRLDVGRSKVEKSPRNSANINSNIKLSINNSVQLNIKVKINMNVKININIIVKIVIWWRPPFIMSVVRHICGHFHGKFCQKICIGYRTPSSSWEKIPVLLNSF